jgi:hypothetical protein
MEAPMAKSYYVNDTAQPNGDHEVHETGCYWLAQAIHTSYLGEFDHCAPAVAVAKRKYPTANGCATCSPDCHTG